MKKYKNEFMFILGIFLAIIIWNIEITSLSGNGQKMLALSLMTVMFWASKVAHPGYTSGLFLSLLLIFKIAEPAEVFSLWSSSLIYIIIGAYLIASAVQSSGLGERIAYNFILKFVDSYKSIIFSIFFLTFFLSLLISHPWYRVRLDSFNYFACRNAGKYNRFCFDDWINIYFTAHAFRKCNCSCI